MPRQSEVLEELNELDALVRASQDNPVLIELRSDPTLPMKAAGMAPDPWQESLIRCKSRQTAVLCTRRAGKSVTTACRELVPCLTRPGWKALIFSPTEDQSKEFLNYVRLLNESIGCPVPLVRESMTELAWANGSVIKAKPDSPRGSRGFTPKSLVIDEGAQVSDELFLSVSPMLVLGECRVTILSTPFGQMGWFYDIWDHPQKLAKWQTFKVTAYECPRIDRDVLEEHRQTMPPKWFDQEYMLAFNAATDAAFGPEAIDGLFSNDDAFLPLGV